MDSVEELKCVICEKEIERKYIIHSDYGELFLTNQVGTPFVINVGGIHHAASHVAKVRPVNQTTFSNYYSWVGAGDVPEKIIKISICKNCLLDIMGHLIVPAGI